tara:strand:+ start:327 stop:1613 length:1287 start_codon:yes stop_codon:yes gene_type:complete
MLQIMSLYLLLQILNGCGGSSDDCTECEECKDCEKCEDCEECKDCEDCEKCEDCEDCEDCEYNLSDAKDNIESLNQEITDLNQEITDLNKAILNPDCPDDCSFTSRLDIVQKRGYVIVGVSGSAVAFSELGDDDSMTGFDADFGRALAAAIFGDDSQVEFVTLTASERFDAVQSGDVDVLIRNTTWAQSRDTDVGLDVGLDFGPIIYYDGQQLMGRESDGFSSQSTIADIDGLTICTNARTTTEKNITEEAKAAGITINLQTYEDFDTVIENFISGNCDIITTDRSALVGRKARQQPEGDNWVIFPATPISKEPLAPVYRQNDSIWADVVNWTIYATIIADEYGVTQGNVDSFDYEANPEMGRLMGQNDGQLQISMGLPVDAFYQVIKQVGNYDEIFTRNLNPVGITREESPNMNWKYGGLLYAPPAL